MKKEEKENAVNDNEIENVAGGYMAINADGSRTLYGDGRGENQGTFSDINDLNAMAKRLGTSTRVRYDNRVW